MRLLLFPSYPVTTNGYGIAVREDIHRLTVNEKDQVIWYVTKEDSTFSHGQVINRYGKFSFKRFYNFLRMRHNTEVYLSDLNGVKADEIDEIFCGEVVFYRALRQLFPNKKIIVRFHNCFARVHDRVNLLGNSNSLSLLYRLNLSVFYSLEREIMSDKNVYKIFISNEDRYYYTSNFGKYDDSEVWGFTPDINRINQNRKKLSTISKIVWYGGLDSHKIDSVNWFVSSVFAKLKIDHPDLEFHLYGKGTVAFNDEKNGIYGHGFYDGNDMPFMDSALYINPDLTGGGVKIKLISYFESGVRFLTTPFGYEGYAESLVDNKYCFVKPSDEWLDFITELV